MPYLGPSVAGVLLGYPAREPLKRYDGGEGAVCLTASSTSCIFEVLLASVGPVCPIVHPGPHPTLNDRPMKAPMSATQLDSPAIREVVRGMVDVRCRGVE